MKKSSIILLLIISLFTVGCTKKEKKDKVVSNNEVVNTASLKEKKCTRSATAKDGLDVKLNYELYYTGDELKLLHSKEEVVSSKDDVLDEYENAYKNIYKNYEGLKYYDAKVIRGDTSVTSDVTINYEKIDIDKLLDIEGEEDNIIENGKASVNKWISLAKKFGTKCEDVD